MPTLRMRQQTHPAVLPQRRALESTPADNPEGGDETGHGRPRGHLVRDIAEGRSAASGTAAAGVTPRAFGPAEAEG
jgi:hypothetical protein